MDEAKFESATAPVNDQLFASDHPRIERKITLADAGGTVVAGSVLGQITVGGEYVLSDDGAADGSETPVAVLAHDKDANGATAEAIIYEAGHFNAAELTFGGAHTADTTRAGLRTLGIYI